MSLFKQSIAFAVVSTMLNTVSAQSSAYVLPDGFSAQCPPGAPNAWYVETI